MSITIQDILKLPSLRQAKVVAGNAGLKQVVSSISVLEYARPTYLQDELFQNKEFQGGEIVISALISIKEDVNAQCACIRRLHEAGEVGLILYYVGIFLESIHPDLIALADALQFPLICMPEKRMDQRYSEVIQEVMELILNDRQKDTYIVTSMLDRISLLPPHQRSMDSVLRMLSDHTHASLYVLDATQHILNQASWPQSGNAEFSAFLETSAILEEGLTPQKLSLGNQSFFGNRLRIQNAAEAISLYILKENEPVNAGMLPQMQEVVQLFVNIWSQSHGAVQSEELIHAIIHDEPAKMRRLAEILNISVTHIHSMWTLHLPDDHKTEAQLRELQTSTETFLHSYYHLVISAIMEDVLIVFMGEEKGNVKELDLGNLFIDCLKEQKNSAIVCGSYTLKDTTSVRHAYSDIIHYLQTARLLYPHAAYITLMQIQYAKKIQETIMQGEEVIQEILSVLTFTMRDEQQKEELLHTLCVYLLDGDMHMQKTAELLFVHKNTVKYRIHLLQEKLHTSLQDMPEVLIVYKACAIYRLLSH